MGHAAVKLIERFEMLIRFSNVIYWITTSLAVITLVGAAATAVMMEGNDRLSLAAAITFCAAIVYGVGRAVRYIIQGV